MTRAIAAVAAILVLLLALLIMGPPPAATALPDTVVAVVTALPALVVIALVLMTVGRPRAGPARASANAWTPYDGGSLAIARSPISVNVIDPRPPGPKPGRTRQL